MLTQTYHLADHDDAVLLKYKNRLPHQHYVRVNHAYVKNWQRHLCDRVIRQEPNLNEDFDDDADSRQIIDLESLFCN